jgi:coenzyme F420-reducing hydrogenase beta subunit
MNTKKLAHLRQISILSLKDSEREPRNQCSIIVTFSSYYLLKEEKINNIIIVQLKKQSTLVINLCNLIIIYIYIYILN